ncbi:MAG: hypothetical protein AABZ09_09835 [Candidatus Binatota bacterium]
MTGSSGTGSNKPSFPPEVEPYKNMINEAFVGKRPVEDIPLDIRFRAADYYEEIAKHVAGSRREEAEHLNLKRAKFLRQGGTPPGNLGKPKKG